MLIFQRLYTLYLREYDKVVSSYKELYSKTNFDKYIQKPPKRKDNDKSGARLQALQAHNKEVFYGDYAVKCQNQKQQPYVVKPEDLKKVRATLKGLNYANGGGEKLAKHGVLNWPEGSDAWYACAPRDEKEPIINRPYIWPRLNKDGKPCCFLTNKDNKKQEIGEEEGTDAVKFDRPLDAKKLVSRGRFGELPRYVGALALSSGYNLIEFKSKKFLPILRFGVASGPDSFVHCLLTALNEDFKKADIKEKRRVVENELIRIAKTNENLILCRQEMYDYTYDEIRERLVAPKSYIDPDMFISLFAKEFDCNIILFQVDNVNPDGDIVIPRSAIVYLNYKVNVKTETVIIVKYQTHQYWNYQCELIVKYIQPDIQFSFKNDDLFVINTLKIIDEANTVYTVSSEKYIKYHPTVII
jgi:hypothetical protein